MFDPIAELADQIQHDGAPSFEWIVAHAGTEAAFADTWRRGWLLEPKARVIALLELRATGTTRRAVAILLELATEVAWSFSDAERQWARRARRWLADYSERGVVAPGAADLLAEVGDVSGFAPRGRAYAGAIEDARTGSFHGVANGIYNVADYRPRLILVAMRLLNAAAPTLAQVVATPAA